MNRFQFNPTKYESELTSIIGEVLSAKKMNQKRLRKILSKYPKDGNRLFTKNQLIKGFRSLQKKGVINQDKKLPQILQKKPTRTISGVTTVTVLTKPFPCPGKCIFCPNDATMPKSYIASEPGAQRALKNRFSPYFQVFNRLKALDSIGHPTEKVELIVLGGTWSYYPKKYQIWFVKECFRALFEFKNESVDIPLKDVKKINPKEFNEEIRETTGKETYNEIINSKEYESFSDEFVEKQEKESTWEDLLKEHKRNETAQARCVGLVLETRPDTLDEKEVFLLRKLGATKIQIGVQTLDKKVNKANKRLETKEQIAKAFGLLRSAGFKIHAHIMPNLYKATPDSDQKTYEELFNSPDFKPDELKIYPTSIIKYTKLSDYFEEGSYSPYSKTVLIDLLASFLEITPEYCRLTRIIRDIPSEEITDGNKTTNLRQLVEQKLEKENIPNPNIRAREIRGEKYKFQDLFLDVQKYDTKVSTEYFLQYITKERKIAAFLRLSIPKEEGFIEELSESSIIREIHVYGPSIEIDKREKGKTQHYGLGTQLIGDAEKISLENKLGRLSVISAIGTREYYKKKGFEDGKLYQHKSLKD